MPIPFTCPNCHEPYKVKDELAGKRVVCKTCKNPMRVPPVGAVVSAEAEALAVSALVDEPGSPEAAAAETIETQCPQCMETVQFEAKFAGKQAPCPSCRRIIRVPVPDASRPTNWRESANRPSLAKQDVDPAMAGAWTANRTIVGREALKEAGVIRDRRDEVPTRTKVLRYVIVGCIAALAVIGTLLFMNRRTVQAREDYVQKGLDLLKAPGDAAPSPLAAAEALRGAAEYYLNLEPPRPEDARKHLETARTRAAMAPPGPDNGLERFLMLSEVALAQADLSGTPAEEQADQRLKWEKVLPELRKTLDSIKPDGSTRDGAMLLQERLTRRLGARGDPNQPMAMSIPRLLYGPQDQADGLAVLGLEVLASGDAERAKQLAAQGLQAYQGQGASPRPPARLVALFVALNDAKAFPQVRPPTAGDPNPVALLAYSEGLARRGDLEQARAAARTPGASFDERLHAHVLVAAAAAVKDPNTEDVAHAVELLEKELGARDLPAWPLIRLGQLCGRQSAPAVGMRLIDILQRHPNPSPRGQAIRAWVIYEVVRSPAAGPPDEATVKAIAPPTALGHLLAWQVLARRNAASGAVTDPTAVVETWPAPVRALGYIGTALGLQKPR